MHRPSTLSRRTRVLAFLLCTVQFVDVLGVTIIVVALPTLQHDLAMSDAQGSLVVSIYALCFGAFLIPAGRLADVFGHKRLLLLGMALFLAASLLGGAAFSGYVVIAARALQGLGAAIAIPAALAILSNEMPEGPARNRALGIWTAAGAAGGVSGFALGGVLTDALGWRSVFLLNSPIILGALVLVPLLMRQTGRIHTDAARTFDVLTALMLPAGMFFTIAGISRIQSAGVFSLPVGGSILVGFFLVIVCARRQRALTEPLVPIEILEARSLRAASMVAFTLTFVTSAAALLITFWLQDVRALNASSSGLLMMSSSIGVVLGSYVGSRMLGATTSIRPVMAGLVALVIATLIQICSLAMNLLPGVITGLAISGAGLGCASVAATVYGLQGSRANHRGIAAGILSAAGPLGTAIGVTMLTTAASIMGNLRRNTTGSPEDAITFGYQCALIGAIGLLLVTLQGLRRSVSAPQRQ